MADVALATAERLDLGRIDVEADHREAALGKSQRERQADVAEPDDAYPGGAVEDADAQVRGGFVLSFGHHGHRTVTARSSDIARGAGPPPFGVVQPRSFPPPAARAAARQTARASGRRSSFRTAGRIRGASASRSSSTATAWRRKVTDTTRRSRPFSRNTVPVHPLNGPSRISTASPGPR